MRVGVRMGLGRGLAAGWPTSLVRAAGVGQHGSSAATSALPMKTVIVPIAERALVGSARSVTLSTYLRNGWVGGAWQFASRERAVSKSLHQAVISEFMSERWATRTRTRAR